VGLQDALKLEAQDYEGLLLCSSTLQHLEMRCSPRHLQVGLHLMLAWCRMVTTGSALNNATLLSCLNWVDRPAARPVCHAG
jgi:hypothetical protein